MEKVKTSRKNGLLRASAVGVAGILLYLPFHTFISTWFGSLFGAPLVWKSWKDVVVFGILLVLVSVVARRGELRGLLSRRVVLLIAIFTLLTIGSAVVAWQNEQTAAGLLMNLRYLAVFLIALVVARWWPISRDRTVAGLAWVGGILGGLGLVQVLLPANFLTLFGYSFEGVAPAVTVDQNSDFLRAFATMSGPNDYAAYAVITLMAAVAYKNYWLTGLIGLGLVLSYSRSAWIGAAVAVGVYAYVKYENNRAAKRWLGWGALSVTALGVMVLLAATQVPTLRLAVFHSSPGESLLEGSTINHLIETTGGVWRVMANPLGCGVGCAGPASVYGEDPKLSENYYVQIAEEVGVAGLAVWVVIFAMVMRQLWQRRADDLARVVFASGCGLAVVGMLLHVWADEAVAMTWWGLAGVVIGGGLLEKRKGLSKKGGRTLAKSK